MHLWMPNIFLEVFTPFPPKIILTMLTMRE